MGQSWAKNILFYPKNYRDHVMQDIPFPKQELYAHVVNKSTQVFSVIGLIAGSIQDYRFENTVKKPCTVIFTRRGFLLGLALTPFLVEYRLRATKSGREEIYDRVYRIRYNRSQTRSAQWCTWFPGVVGLSTFICMPHGAYFSSIRPLFDIMIVSYAGAALASAVVPHLNERKPPMKVQ